MRAFARRLPAKRPREGGVVFLKNLSQLVGASKAYAMPNILQFKITLRGGKPPIWRRFQVTDDYRLDRFHQVIQIVMGWWNAHLHEFDIFGQRYGMHMPHIMDSFDEGEDETKYHLKDFKLKAGEKMDYLYDFGDSWEHQLLVEEVSPGTLNAPMCLKGKGACPPEDCGGIWGYQEVMEAVKDPRHPEHEEMMEWLPEDFDPTHFNIESINEELRRFGEWHRKNPKAKSTPWHQI